MNQLNPQQQQVVLHRKQPALVIAGAGSGKTRVITHRVAQLVKSGVPPSSIMMLTFTNKAANEMAERVMRELKQPCAIVHGTFHSVANRFLRRHASKIGYESNFTILDTSDESALIATAMAEVVSDVSVKKRLPKKSVIQSLFSLSFNLYACREKILETNYSRRIFELEETIYQRFSHLMEWTDELLQIFLSFRQKKKEGHLMGFDDLLENWLDLLLRFEGMTHGIEYILVDEYQDTNSVQSEILDALCQNSQKLMVVGDDAQSIYSWRGARVKNILDFPKKYQMALVYYLEHNYRSTPQILQLANACIAHNTSQFEKTLYSTLPDGTMPEVYQVFSTQEEAQIIVEQILRKQSEGVALDQMSVLYRTHLQSSTLQLELERFKIPFEVRSGTSFFEQAHIRDMIAFVRVLVNPLDEIAWRRILEMVPGIGQKTAEKIFQVFARQQAIRFTESNKDLSSKIPKKAKEIWDKLQNCFAQITPPDLLLSEVVELTYETFYGDYLMKSFDNPDQREADLFYLSDFVKQFTSKQQFLDQMSLVGSYHKKKNEGEKIGGRVVLTTIHQAKGLEWHSVIVMGLTRGLFPHQRCLEFDEGLEEERRLFYVAITRAKQHLTLTSPFMPPYQRSSLEEAGHSLFLEELPRDMLCWHDQSSCLLDEDALEYLG